MAAKKKLGKGLNEIFGQDIDSFLDELSTDSEKARNAGGKEIKIKDIRPNPYQPRKDFDDRSLNELAESIKVNGVFQPVLIRKSVNGYELVAGERRLRASKLAGKTTIPAIIVEADDQKMMEISLLENIQREDLNPLEEAQAYEQLIKKLGYTQEELAKRLGKSRANVSNMLRLLHLPDEIKTMVADGKLSYGQARTLLSMDNEDKMIALAQRAAKEGMSVRELENLTSSKKKKKNEPVKKTIKRDPFMEDVIDRLRKKYATKVEIRNNTISIRYTDVEDLNRILEIMDLIED